MTTRSGVSTTRTLARVEVSRVRTPTISSRQARSTSSTSGPGTGTPVAAEAAGRSTVSRRRWAGSSRSRCQPSTSGSASRRSVSAVGAQSTTTRSQSPLLGLVGERRERGDLLGAGQRGELVGDDGVDTHRVEHPEQVVAHDLPVGLDGGVRPDGEGVQPRLDLGGLAPGRARW